MPAKFLDRLQGQVRRGPAPRATRSTACQALQVILAAIEKSDGTRDGVRDAVFEGGGITIPADKAVVGKDITIDPASGDVNAKDISVELVKGGKETFLKAWPVA